MPGLATTPDAASPISARKAPANSARIWWRVHQWAGLKLSILMSFVLLTGTLAVFGYEIDWLINPSMRVAPSSAPAEPDWPSIARTAFAYEQVEEVYTLDAPLASAFAATATVMRLDGEIVYLDIHPGTGALQGERSTVGAQVILRNLHRHLNLPVAWGVPIVSALSVLLLVTLVTSLVVYKRWWRGFAKPIRRRNARTGWGDFHRLAGVWSLWFVALMAVTGLWYLVESIVAPAPDLPFAEAEPGKGFSDDIAGQVAASLAAVRAKRPGYRVSQIQMPADDDGAMLFSGDHDGAAVLVRPRANAVWTEAAIGQVLLGVDSTALSAHQRISEAADPLHFGTWGGYWTRIVWFVAGLLMTGLAVSGATLYAMRLANAKEATARARPLLARAWRGMGIWAWPATTLVVVALALIPSLFAPAEG